MKGSGRRMRIKLSDERRADLVSGLQCHMAKEFEIELSDFQARELLDYFVRHLGPSVYNQAIQDARSFVQEKLTDLEVRKAKPRATAYKLSDGGALWLQVNPSGSKKWRYRYRIGGVENVFALGDYETMSLEQARKARDRAPSSASSIGTTTPTRPATAASRTSTTPAGRSSRASRVSTRWTPMCGRTSTSTSTR